MIKKILVSQPKPTSDKSPYYDLEAAYKVSCVFRPFVKVEGLTAKEFRQQKVSILEHTAIVFTSRHAIDHFFLLAKELHLNILRHRDHLSVHPEIRAVSQAKGVLRNNRKDTGPRACHGEA